MLTRERPDYVKTPEELELLPDIADSLRTIRHLGFVIVIVTNQSAVGRGLTSEEQISLIHEKLRAELQKLGCSIDAVYYCPHRPEDKCDCRKPAPGLIVKAAKDLGIEISQSWVIGDKDIDLEAAERAGCRGIRIPTNENKLAEAVRLIVSSQSSNIDGNRK